MHRLIDIFARFARNDSQVIYHLDDLDGGIKSGGFGDGFYEGIVLLMILILNPRRQLHEVLASGVRLMASI